MQKQYTNKQKIKYYNSRINELLEQVRETADENELENLLNKLIFCVRRRKQIVQMKKGA